MTLGACGLWLGTRTRAGGTATLAYTIFFAADHGSMDYRLSIWIFIAVLQNSETRHHNELIEQDEMD